MHGTIKIRILTFKKDKVKIKTTAIFKIVLIYFFIGNAFCARDVLTAVVYTLPSHQSRIFFKPIKVNHVTLNETLMKQNLKNINLIKMFLSELRNVYLIIDCKSSD